MDISRSKRHVLPWPVLALLALMMLLPTVSAAQDAAPAESKSQYPPALQPWVPWVKHGLPDLDCPTVGTTRHCTWPGVLAIDVGKAGATFTMNVWMDRKGKIRLPGGKDHWPQQVRTETGQAVVVARSSSDLPEAELPRGAHLIRGVFEWTEVPEVLPVPSDVGNISLSMDDARVAYPRLQGGQLFLGDGASDSTTETDSVRASIYRRIYDGSPLTITTRIQLNVSGRAREVVLGKVLVAASRPTAIESSLPTRIQPEGDVTVYVRPGSHLITISSVIAGKVESLTAPEPGQDIYDPQEVWVWIPNEMSRSVELDGLSAVDPERTSLPEDWRGETTLLAEPKSVLTLKEKRRGAAEAAPNLVQLNRELWLDLDGLGYTVRDRLTGTLNQGWRLDYGGNVGLGRVRDQRENTDLFITKNPESEQSGVELRSSNLNLEAELRLDKSRTDLRIVGWDHDVQSLGATLKLPPGWTLLGGVGVDRLPGTWFESWTLWDFFFVLMIALSIGKLCGWWWTPLTILALCLAHGHEDAPQWVWIHLIASLALLRVLPNTNWRRIVVAYRYIALIALVVILSPYARDQIRFGLHPQVADVGSIYTETTTSAYEDSRSYKQDMAPAAPMNAPEPVEESGEYDEEERAEWAGSDVALEQKSISFSRSKGGKGGYIGGLSKRKVQLQQIDPNAIVQTGPGLPTWQWTSWRLEWTGPVRKDHQISLWLVSPFHNLLLALLRVALLILIALAMVSPRDMFWREPKRHLGAGLVAGIFAALSMTLIPALVLVGNPTEVSAEEPIQVQQVQNVDNLALSNLAGNASSVSSPSMLDELRNRIIEDAACPRCVTVSRADIVINDLSWSMTAEVHARKTAAWHLPGPIERLGIESVIVDGLPTTRFRRETDGLTSVRLAAGRHTIKMQGRLAKQNVVTVQFEPDTRPQYVTFRSDGWSVDGISPLGVPDGSLQLTRKDESEVGDAAQGAELPPWYQIRRELNLGLPWQIRTVVSRVDSTRPQLVRIPVLANENVITEAVRVEEGKALVDFPRDVATVEFMSEIPIKESLVLSAAEGEPWTETWSVACSRIWRCSFQGIPPIERVAAGEFRPTWQPWPGESLTISVVRPEGAEGQASTIDTVSYQVTPGKRLMQAELRLVIRASQGGRQIVTLPAEAELQTVTLDGVVKNIRPTDGKVGLPYRPGKQTFELKWQQPWKRTPLEQVPLVDIGSSAVNVETVIRLGDDRWLLAVKGPRWGPAILFWSHLVILLIIAMFLGRLRRLPIKTWEWLLLVIGLSQLPVVAGLPIVFWFVLLSWRRREPQEVWWKFDLTQLVSMGVTVLALGALYAAIHTNLLIDVDMQVRGANSSNSMLRWYVDQVSGELPTPQIVSLPILVWRVAMLIWAFWLVSRLIKWAKWGWDSFSRDGLWKKPLRKPKGPKGGQGGRAKPAGPAPVGKNRPKVPPPRQSAATDEETTKAVPTVDEQTQASRKKHDTMPGTPIPTGEHEAVKREDIEKPSAEQAEETPMLFPPPDSEIFDESDD